MAKNEFECVHVRRFAEPDIVQFTEAVDVTHGIYEHRYPHVSLQKNYTLTQALNIRYT